MIDKRMQELDADQAKAILQSFSKNTLVLSSPGSGKTRTLQTRYLYLVEKMHIDPKSICVVTFTNKAANELKDRIKRDLPNLDLNKAYIGTFHGLCVRFLHAIFPSVTGEECSFTIIDEMDSRRLIRECFDDLQIEGNANDMGECYEAIGKMKSDMISPQDAFLYSHTDTLQNQARVYLKYQEYLKQRDLLDFDEIILRVIEYLEKFPVFKTVMHNKFKYIAIDECMPYNTPVIVSGNKLMKLGDIVEGKVKTDVLTYNIYTGQQEYKAITGYHKIIRSKPMYRAVCLVKDSCSVSTRKTKYGMNIVVATEDHKILVDNNKWVPISQLKIGDTVQLESSLTGVNKPIECKNFNHKYKFSINGRTSLSNSINKINSNKNRTYNKLGKITKRGGNGTGPSPAEQSLLNNLDSSWIWNHPIVTGIKAGNGYPTCYKVDIANINLKIAIEVDGESHRANSRKEQDKKKDDLLTSMGWRIIRFSNKEVFSNVDIVINKINSAVKGFCINDCPIEAEIIDVHEIPMHDSYVYDIDVEDNHNFYANGVLVHNCQDTSKMQYKLLQLLLGKSNNIFLVADADQCWDGGNEVNTSTGIKKVSDLIVGDLVETVYKQQVWYKPVTNITRHRNDKLLNITTESGNSISITETHLCFATEPDFSDGSYYLYMMYRKDMGYRLGITSGGIDSMVRSRAHSEHPDRMWLLGRFENITEAALCEEQLSLRFQVPTNPYRHNGRGIAMSQSGLDKLFNEFGSNGERILDIYNLNFDYPNYIPQATTKGRGRTIVNLIMNQKKHGNEVSYESNGTKIRRMFADYKQAYTFASSVMQDKNADIIAERFSHGSQGGYLRTILASQLLVGMHIPIVLNGEMKLSKITSIIACNDVRVVYDVEIETTGNMVANNVVTHNCLYSWRGANPEMFACIDKIFPGIQILELGSNYRSTKYIVNAADGVIQNNIARFPKNMHTNNPQGVPVEVVVTSDRLKEASYVANQIVQLAKTYKHGDIAILYRTNSISRNFEEALMKAHVPYELIAGTSFYQRKEIKDFMSVLKVVNTITESISLHRVLTMLPSIGPTTVKKITDDPNGSEFAIRAMKSKAGCILNNWLDKVELVRDYIVQENLNLYETVRHIYINLYKDTLNTYENLSERFENIESFITMAAEYEASYGDNSLLGFVNYLLLYSAQDELTKNDTVKLITGHGAKGLEWPVVFVVACNEDIIPYVRSKSPKEVEEERRLFYVMMTRAEKRLFITYSTSYRTFKGDVTGKPSRFINEIPTGMRTVKYL